LAKDACDWVDYYFNEWEGDNLPKFIMLLMEVISPLELAAATTVDFRCFSRSWMLVLEFLDGDYLPFRLVYDPTDSFLNITTVLSLSLVSLTSYSSSCYSFSFISKASPLRTT